VGRTAHRRPAHSETSESLASCASHKRSMKALYILLTASALAAFFLLPVDGEITGSVAFAAAFAMILRADYSRPYSWRISKGIAARSREALRLAA
jgi:hypothetical protein